MQEPWSESCKKYNIRRDIKSLGLKAKVYYRYTNADHYIFAKFLNVEDLNFYRLTGKYKEDANTVFLIGF